MITGIPYFGENTQEIVEEIPKLKIKQQIRFNSLYDLINNTIQDKLVIIIDDNWLTWLNDIVFNYRDNECYIPYYEYKLYKLDDNKKHRSNNNGHLILKDNNIYIRYEYKYKELKLNINNIKLEVVNIDTMERFIFTTNKWINNKNIDVDKLYELYINSCFKEDDFLYNKHIGGYHYIEKSIKSFKNVEKNYRDKIGLNNYSIEYSYKRDYRDVRNFKYDEVIQRYGLINNIENYKIRRLKFESYLFCCLRQGLVDKMYPQLGKTVKLVKIGNDIKLIIKHYWLDNTSIQINRKTWSRY